jgi:transcriptional regulator with XRE-family HTH domain
MSRQNNKSLPGVQLGHLVRQRLIEARIVAGYGNRKVFSEEIGVPYRTVTNYENGAREPGIEYISKVADFCGCTTDWLLCRDIPPEEVESMELDLEHERQITTSVFTIGECLRTARKNVGMTQRQVANAIGITESTYCGYEINRRQPSIDKIIQLASVLNVSCDYLLGVKPLQTEAFSMAKLSERIKECRTSHGMTLVQLADLTGVKDATVQRWESGNIKNVKYETVETLANVFHCTPAYLMGWSDEKSPTPISEDGLDDLDRQLLSRIKTMSQERKRALLDLLSGDE